MKELLKTIEQTMTSMELAELTGKNHAHILRDIRELNESYEKLYESRIGFKLKISDLGFGRKREDRYCQLSKMQTFDLLTGYSRELRIKVNRRWAELEANLQLRVPAPVKINGVECQSYAHWLLANGYSVMSGSVRRRMRNFPNQFVYVGNMWYMSKAIGEYYKNYKVAMKTPQLPAVSTQQMKMNFEVFANQ